MWNGLILYMTILINNPIQQTYIFISIFILTLIFSIRKRDINVKDIFPVSLTQELKGFAILAVIFIHVGYFLSENNQFLFPLSIIGGVGVNIFLFLSGYGLTVSSFKKIEKPFDFYKNRLLKLMIPMWIVVSLFLILDFFFLNISYTTNSVIKTFLGIFTKADMYSDLNSPLWYFTFILFYYLLFPWIFNKKHPWISSVIFLILGYVLVYLKPQSFKDVLELYKLHLLAFPCGILFAWILQQKEHLLKNRNLFSNISIKILSYIIFYLSLIIFIYTAYNSGVGQKYYIEEFISLITVFTAIIIFTLKKYEFRFLTILGIYSYEIYLLHWPLMYRYDFLYKFFPAWIATFAYLFLLLGIGFLLKKVSNYFFRGIVKNKIEV